MLNIEPPTKELLVSILSSLVEEKVTREQVVTWQKNVIDQFDYHGPGVLTVPLTVNEGYWEFVSLSALTRKSEIKSDPYGYFIRERDLLEYIAVLKNEDLNEEKNEINYIRPHQLPKICEEPLPILSFRDEAVIERNTMRSVRGVMDSLNNLQELVLFKYGYSIFTMVLHHEHETGLSVLNSQLNVGKDNIVALLNSLEVAPQDVDWVSPSLDSEKCRLNRLDDNSNTFPVADFSSYILAELTRIQYENKGHKQTYSIMRDL